MELFTRIPTPFEAFCMVVLPIALTFWIKFVKMGRVCKSDVDLTGKTVVITGANSGIGKATAVGLAKRNARVIMACRNEEKALAAVKEVRDQSGNNQVHYMNLDLADFESIRQFVEEYSSTEPYLHILINNAGIVGRGKTKQGFDKIFGTNHLGPFLLTNLLLPVMRKTAKHCPVRIVNVSADLYRISKIKFDNLNPNIDDKTPYSEIAKQYAHSKLMNIYFTSELSKRLWKIYKSKGITTYSLHPGVIRSGLGSELSTSWVLDLLRVCVMSVVFKSPYYGSQTTLYCCLEKGIESESGGYYRDCKLRRLEKCATDDDIGAKLWQKSAELCGLE